MNNSKSLLIKHANNIVDYVEKKMIIKSNSMSKELVCCTFLFFAVMQ